jgi:phosphatidylglycerophosphatase A
MMRMIVIFLATAAYAGFVPLAPGTAGSVVGLVLAWSLLGWAGAHYWLAIAAFGAAFVAGCWIAGRAEAVLGRHDSSHIVVDEVMGMIATMFLNPLDRLHLAIGFVLFRVFDIVKVFPASLIDRRVRGGTGVMLDDLAAAVYANIALRFVAHLIV